MRKTLSLSVALLALGGCGASNNTTDVDDSGLGSHHGRYEGVGVYDASLGWQRTVGQARPKDAHAALKDDDHVIVVVDTATGEVRQCGDHSGYCVAMNPWGRTLTPAQQLPVELYPIDKNGNVIEPDDVENVETVDEPVNSSAKTK
jgi:hypothetical protein